MASISALNDLERLDSLLQKVDNVRYALPAVVNALGSSSNSGSIEERLAEYRTKVNRGNSSLEELHEGAVANAGEWPCLGVIDLVARAEIYRNSQDLLRYRLQQAQDAGNSMGTTRPRRDPYTHRHTAAARHGSSSDHRWTMSRYPPSSILIDSLEVCNDELKKKATKYPVLQRQALLTKENKRLFVVELKAIATFYVFVSFPPHGPSPIFSRINAVAISESKRPYESSDHPLWREVSLQASEAVRKHCSHKDIDVDCILAVLASYASIHATACALPTCSRLLHPRTMLLPTSRAYRVRAGNQGPQVDDSAGAAKTTDAPSSSSVVCIISIRTEAVLILPKQDRITFITCKPSRSAITTWFSGSKHSSPPNRFQIFQSDTQGRKGSLEEKETNRRRYENDMKASFTIITIFLSSLSSALSNALKTGHDIPVSEGLQRHLRAHKGAGVRRMERNGSNNTLASIVTHDSMASQGGQQLEKRSFYGQGTFFQPGQGACGWTASSRDHIAALNSNQYGNMGQPSPHCGQYIWIRNTQTGAQTRAQVQDACPGCSYGSLDLSPAAFDDLAPESQGVVQIEWDFE